MLALDPGKTALVIVDLQQGILALPSMPHDGADVVARAAGLGRALANAGGTVVLVNVDYSDGYADCPRQAADAPMKLPASGLPPGWATLAPEVAALPARVRITKRQQSAFFVAPALHDFAVANILPRIARVRLSSDIAASMMTDG